MGEQELLDMNIHDKRYFPDGNMEVLRVFKGWIYTFFNREGDIVNSVYVPEHDQR